MTLMPRLPARARTAPTRRERAWLKKDLCEGPGVCSRRPAIGTIREMSDVQTETQCTLDQDLPGSVQGPARLIRVQYWPSSDTWSVNCLKSTGLTM